MSQCRKSGGLFRRNGAGLPSWRMEENPHRQEIEAAISAEMAESAQVSAEVEESEGETLSTDARTVLAAAIGFGWPKNFDNKWSQVPIQVECASVPRVNGGSQRSHIEGQTRPPEDHPNAMNRPLTAE